MKLLIQIIVGIASMAFIYWLDAKLINYIISVLPVGSAEWHGIIRVILWVLAVCWTTSIGVVVGILTAYIIGLFFKPTLSHNTTRWQQRIKQLQREQEQIRNIR